MHSDIGSAHHLFIADSTGRSVAVEWVNGQMATTETKVLNNHYLCSEKEGTGKYEASFRNEHKLLKLRKEAFGKMSPEQLADAMFAVLSLQNRHLLPAPRP